MLDRERIQLMNQSKFKDLSAKKKSFAIYDLDTDCSGLLATNLEGKPFITRRFYFGVLLTYSKLSTVNKTVLGLCWTNC